MLNKLRKSIDKIDAKIARYLQKRCQIVDKIAYLKQKDNIPIYNKQREENHIKTILEPYKNDDDCKKLINEVFITIYKESRNIQNNKSS